MNTTIPDCGCREWLGEDSYDCDRDGARTKLGERTKSGRIKIRNR